MPVDAGGVYNGGMRVPLALFLPLAALAQPPTPGAIPPPLRQAASLINDFGNTRRYAAENAAVAPPATNAAATNAIVAPTHQHKHATASPTTHQRSSESTEVPF